MALWLYRDGAGRTYVDSDILVSPDERGRAERCLGMMGFIGLYNGTSCDEQDPHGAPWWRSRDGICVDLHTGIAGVELDRREAWQLLSHRTETMQVGGAEVRVLVPTARALNVVLHAAHNGVANRQSLRDLELILERFSEGEWMRVLRLAEELGALPSFTAGLRLNPRGIVLAKNLGLASSTLTRVELRAMAAPSLALGFETLLEKTGAMRKLGYLARNLVPTPAFMRLWLPIARRGPLGLAIAYAWRWLWLARHALPGYLFWKRVRNRTEHGPSVMAERSLTASAVDAPTEEKQRRG